MAVEKDDRGWRRRAEALMEGVRGKEIAMIFQNSALGAEPLLHDRHAARGGDPPAHELQGESEAKERAIHWLERVRIDSPAPALRQTSLSACPAACAARHDRDGALRRAVAADRGRADHRS